MKHRLTPLLAGLAFLLIALPCHAHTGAGATHGYVNGLLHPLLGLDHVLVMLGVGLWGAVLGRRLRWLLPAVFLLMMALGASAGAATLPLPGLPLPIGEIGIVFSVVILGLILASERKVPAGLAIVLVSAFALAHGYAHTKEMESGMAVAPYVAGFLTSTTLLLGVGASSCLLSPPAISIVRAMYAAACTIFGLVVVSGV